MHFKRAPFVTALLVLALGVCALADQTDDYIKTRLDEFHLPGLSLAVVHDGKIVKTAAYGLSNREQGTAATPETVYKIGSVSKQFIATGIMLLVQEGRLTVDDRISKYLDGTPPAWEPISIRHLLSHTGGLVRESPAFNPAKVQSDADVVKGAYGVPLRFTPGSKYEYSNTGYFALAQIITRVAGKPWWQYLDEKVFKPAGMSTTAPTNVTPTLANRAVGYTGDDNGRIADDWRALRPSGAFLSTVLDLAKWDALLYSDRVLTEASRKQMWTPVRLNDGSATEYGFGWQVRTINGRRVVSHGGSMPGFVSQFVRFVDDRTSVIVLTNGDDADIGSIAMGVASRHLPTPVGAERRGVLDPLTREPRIARGTSVFDFGNLALDVGELLLHVARGVAHALVVDRWTELADEEVEQAVGAEVAERLVELRGEVFLDGAQQAGTTLGRQFDPHG